MGEVPQFNLRPFPMSSPAPSPSPSKRKLEDIANGFFSVDSFPVASRMRKDENGQDSPSSSPNLNGPRSSVIQPTRSLTSLQFFVRVLSKKSIVFQAEFTDTIMTIHQKIQEITGIPVNEQRLIYRGKQLQWEKTLAECNVHNDADLQLVGRMRSTEHPQAWQLINDVFSKIFFLCKNQSSPLPPGLRGLRSKSIKSMLLEFLSMTPRRDLKKAASHLRIFISSFAPSALVMLYTSSHKLNRDVAGEAIRQFVGSIKSVLCTSLFHHCAPIVLEFCKSLSRSVGPDDPLYIMCRSSLGTLVESICKQNGIIEIPEIFQFLEELAAKLSDSLVLSMDTSSHLGPSLAEVKDFTAFVIAARYKIREHVVSCGAIKFPLGRDCYLSAPYKKEVTIVYQVFLDLLDKLLVCLEKVDEHAEMQVNLDNGTLFFGWCQYLVILKELDGISKLFDGAEQFFWENMRQRKDALCYLALRFAKRTDDHLWLLMHKEVTVFEVRRHLTLMMLPEAKDDYDEQHEMLIDRSQILSESFQYIAQAETQSLRAGLYMEFKNEEATGPGVLREWFVLVCQAIFNPQNALFLACPKDRRRFFPNPECEVDSLHLDYFIFAGRLIALALMHKIQVGVVLDRVFFLQLAGEAISFEDIQDADPYMYSSCKQILEMDPEAVDQDALGLTFSIEIEELGSRKLFELCPNGKKIAVNSKNRRQYVDSLIQYRFVCSIIKQVNHFAQGFADIMNNERLQICFFQSLDLEDFDLMLHGSEVAISTEDWKAHTEYYGYRETDPQITWFWKIVERMSTEQKKVLLFFWTSIKYLPVEGFRGLASRLYLYKSSESFDRLPSSHTCFFRLCIPAYPSMSIMRNRLHVITQEHVGSSFGTW